jgi:hypothetical protein
MFQKAETARLDEDDDEEEDEGNDVVSATSD